MREGDFTRAHGRTKADRATGKQSASQRNPTSRSDVHLRPREHHAEARYRIDGSLVLVGNFNSALVPAIAARIKVLANLDVTERRLAQDGAIHMDTSTGTVDMRVSIMRPSMVKMSSSESWIAISIAPATGHGFNEADGKKDALTIDRNQGLILVTGPTGSGKTTLFTPLFRNSTLGSIRLYCRRSGGIPHRWPGADSDAARYRLGFPQVLRHILRHDPDIVLIGEIRDAETAKIAIESALTGHLVFSTSTPTVPRRPLPVCWNWNSALPGHQYARWGPRAATCASQLQRCKAQENVPQDIRDILKVGKTKFLARRGL